jgi:hypothetical protein
MNATIPSRENGTDDAPTITYHTEARAQGGRRYARCEHCRRESVPADPDRLTHADDCPVDGRGA